GGRSSKKLPAADPEQSLSRRGSSKTLAKVSDDTAPRAPLPFDPEQSLSRRGGSKNLPPVGAEPAPPSALAPPDDATIERPLAAKKAVDKVIESAAEKARRRRDAQRSVAGRVAFAFSEMSA